MGHREVWGFDPDEAARAQSLFRDMIEPQGSTYYSLMDERKASIPPSVRSQICELRRIFRL